MNEPSLSDFYVWIVQRYTALLAKCKSLQAAGIDVLARCGESADEFGEFAREYYRASIELLQLEPCFVIAAKQEYPENLPTHDAAWALWWERFQSERRESKRTAVVMAADNSATLASV